MTLKNRISFYLVLGMAAVTHFLVTFVVLLFLLSTLNISARNMQFHGSLKYAEIVLTLVIFIISVIIFLKGFRRISFFIKHTMFREPFD